MQINITVGVTEELAGLLDRLATRCRCCGISNAKGEITMNYVVKDDNPDVGFTVSVGDVLDAEGNAIPDAQLDLTAESSDENVIGVTFDAATKTGSVHFGAPGTAALTVSAKSGGSVLASGSDGFTVTTGDPASVASISTSFDGLTPAAPPSDGQ